jgi:hypothetical protein
MKANPPQPPFKKGGGLFGISSGRVSSFTVKKVRCFFSPLFEGGRGGFAFHRTPKRPTKNRPCVCHNDGLFSQSKRTRRSGVKLDYATATHTKLKCKTEALAFKLSAGNKERNRCCALTPNSFINFG